MKKLVGLAVVSMGLSMVACAAPAQTQDPVASAAGKSAEALSITEETDTVLRGSFNNADSVVTFEERLESPFLKTTLSVNGASFDYELDIVHSKLSIDGHSNTVLAADSDVLTRLEKALDRLGAPTKMREGLYKTVAYIAAAPRGTTLMQKVVTPNVAVTDETNRSYCESDDGTTYLCGCNTIPSGCGATYVGTSGSNPLYHASGVSGVGGGTNYYGGYVNGCSSTPSYTHEHDVCEYSASSDHESGQGSYHGRVTWGSRCGWSASACEGRCGAGCPNSYNFYITKDCLDHDTCLNNHPSASSTSTYGDCGNEYDHASGDFSFGTGSSFASACGSYMIGENSR